MRSFRTRAIIEALETVGHTNVELRWVPIVLGTRCGYLFVSDQQPEETQLGQSLSQALANVVARRVA